MRLLQLGDGNSGTFSSTPVDVSGLSSGVVLIALGAVRLYQLIFRRAFAFVHTVALWFAWWIFVVV